MHMLKLDKLLIGLGTKTEKWRGRKNLDLDLEDFIENFNP